MHYRMLSSRASTAIILGVFSFENVRMINTAPVRPPVPPSAPAPVVKVQPPPEPAPKQKIRPTRRNKD